MVQIHQLLGMLLVLISSVCSYHLPGRMQIRGDSTDVDNALKIKMMRLLRYANRFKHGNRENLDRDYGLDEYDDYGYNFYPEQGAIKRDDYRYSSNRRGIAIPFNYVYDLYDIPETMKRNEMIVNTKVKPTYDSDEYDEKSDWGYDDVDYQKLLNNYVQRKSEQRNQHKVRKDKQACHHHHRHLPHEKELQIRKHHPGFQHKSPLVKESLVYDYVDENEILDPPVSRPKHKYKGFQLFMLNDDDDISASMVVDEVRPSRTTVLPKHADFALYEAQAQEDDYSIPVRTHKFRRQEQDIVSDEDKVPLVEEIFVKSPMKAPILPKHLAILDDFAKIEPEEHRYSKYRRDESETDPSLVKIKVSDIEQYEPSISDDQSESVRLETAINSKHTKDSDYDSENEKIVHIPPLKHIAMRKDKVFNNKDSKIDKTTTLNKLFTTKFHRLSKVPKRTELAENEYRKTENPALARDYEEDDRFTIEDGLKNSNSYLTTSTVPSSISPKHAEPEDYEPVIQPKDYEAFLNMASKEHKLGEKDDYSCYGEDKSIDSAKNCKKPTNYNGKKCPSSSVDYDLETPKISCDETPCAKHKPTCPQTNTCDETTEPCGTEKNPCKPTLCDDPCKNLGDNVQYPDDPQTRKEDRPFTSQCPSSCPPKQQCPSESFKTSVKPQVPNKSYRPKNEYESKRPDGLTSESDVSSFTETPKVQKTPVEGGEDPIISHLIQGKDNVAPLKSTLTTKFSDYREYETSTKSDKRNIKRQKVTFSGVETVDDYDEETLLAGFILPKLYNITTSFGESFSEPSSEGNFFVTSERSSTTVVPKHVASSDFTTNDDENKMTRRNEAMDDEETLLEGLKLPEVENTKGTLKRDEAVEEDRTDRKAHQGK